MKQLLFKWYLLLMAVMAWMLAGITYWAMKTNLNDGGVIIWLLIGIFSLLGIFYMVLLYDELFRYGKRRI